MPRRIMDYPSAFGGWHSVISSGHMLTVLGFLSFLAMLADSFYEARAPISKTKGVSRLSNRLAFFCYEQRKLSFFGSKALALPSRRSQSRVRDTYLTILGLESANVSYLLQEEEDGAAMGPD